jgi:hypothetical protein
MALFRSSKYTLINNIIVNQKLVFVTLIGINRDEIGSPMTPTAQQSTLLV